MFPLACTNESFEEVTVKYEPYEIIEMQGKLVDDITDSVDLKHEICNIKAVDLDNLIDSNTLKDYQGSVERSQQQQKYRIDDSQNGYQGLCTKRTSTLS